MKLFKSIWLVMFIFVASVSIVIAAANEESFYPEQSRKDVIVYEETISSDATYDTAGLKGTMIVQVNLYASADSAISFKLEDADGYDLIPAATHDATGGDRAYPIRVDVLTDDPTFTIANLGSGTLKVTIICMRGALP